MIIIIIIIIIIIATNDRGSSGGQRSISPGQQSGSIAGRHGTVKKNINRLVPAYAWNIIVLPYMAIQVHLKSSWRCYFGLYPGIQSQCNGNFSKSL